MSGETGFHPSAHRRSRGGNPMPDIGVVIYRKGPEPGTLSASWHHGTHGGGTGLAVDGPVRGFPGTYRVRYFDLEGRPLSAFELRIERSGDHYDLTWLDGGVIKFRGLGMDSQEGLVAGWHAAMD